MKQTLPMKANVRTASASRRRTLRYAIVCCGIALAAADAAWSQWSSEDVEIAYRDGRRATVRASPFLGISEREVKLGRGGTLSRSDIRFVCFKACPASLPATAADSDTVFWADGTQTTGAFSIGGEYDGNVVRQGDKTISRSAVRFVQFAETPASGR